MFVRALVCSNTSRFSNALSSSIGSLTVVFFPLAGSESVVTPSGGGAPPVSGDGQLSKGASMTFKIMSSEKWVSLTSSGSA